METKTKQNGQAKVAKTVADKNAPQFVAGNPVNEVSKTGEESKAPESPKQEETKPLADTPKPQEASKKEIKAQFEEVKPALNLEQTLRRIKELNRLSNQREKLINTIDELQAFEIKQEDEAEETSLNHFQRCELTIRDDNGDTFNTQNPFIIDQVSKMIGSLCLGKLTEVEAQISLNL